MDNKLFIRLYPNIALRTAAQLIELNYHNIEDIDKEILYLADQMLEIMYDCDGIGLAANQVGELKRLIVFDLHPEKEGKDPCTLINPEIIFSSGEQKLEESCLSVINYSAEITRNAQVKVRGINRQGDHINIEANDLLAACLQHEIDHLNGILYIDHISNLKRTIYKKKLKKAKRGRKTK